MSECFRFQSGSLEYRIRKLLEWASALEIELRETKKQLSLIPYESELELKNLLLAEREKSSRLEKEIINIKTGFYEAETRKNQVKEDQRPE